MGLTCMYTEYIVYMYKVLSIGGGRGEASPPPPTAQLPPPPKWFACDSIYQIRIVFLSSITPAFITQELKFSLFKLNQIIKCLSFCASHGRGHIPLPYPPSTATLSTMASPPPPPPQISNPR